MTARQWKPVHAWAKREDGRLHLHVEARDAVRAILSTGADSVTVAWCQREDMMGFARARLQR